MNGKTESNNHNSERQQIMAENTSKKFENADNQIIPRTQSAAAKPKTKLKATSNTFTIPPHTSSTKEILVQSQPFIPENQQITMEQIPMTTSGIITKPIPEKVEFPTTFVPSSATSSSNDLNQSITTTQTNTAPTTEAPKPKKKLQLKKDAQEFNILTNSIPPATEQLFKDTKVEEKAVDKGEWGTSIPKKNKSTDKSPEKRETDKTANTFNLAPTKTQGEQSTEAKPVEPEIKEPEEKKPEPTPEQTFVPPQKEPEVKTWSRTDFEALIEKFKTDQTDKELPEVLKAITDRKINLTKVASKPPKKQPLQQNKSNEMNQSTGNMRSSKPRPTGEEGVDGSGKTIPNWRPEMSEEEKKKRRELQENVGKWNAGIKVGDDQDEKNKREIRMNLNKLTPQNFDAVKEDLINIVSQKPEYVDKIAELIIENAWTQKRYANIYAKLCNFFGSHEKIPSEGEGDSKKKKNRFRTATLKRIQRVFQNEEQIDSKINKKEEEMTKEEKIELHDRKLKKILGNVCFIGELFLEKFIVIDIIRIITHTLLSSFLSEYDKYQKAHEKPLFRNYEDTLEGLLKFYELIGKEFEEKEKSKNPDKTASAKLIESFEENLLLAHSSLEGDELPPLPDGIVTLEDLFKIFDTIHEQANLTHRLKALISNLKHRKENNWNAPLYKNQGPQKIDEIHQEYHKELEQQEKNKEMYYEEMNASRRGGKDGRKGKGETIAYIQYEPKLKPSTSTSAEEKIDLSGVKAENVVMKPQRGKQGDKQESAKKEEVKNEEDELELIDGAKRDFKEIYEKLEDNNLEDMEADVTDILKLMKERMKGIILAIGYFQTFYDGKISRVNLNRIPLAKILLENGYISQDDFIQGFAEGTKDIYFSDFPQSGAFFADVFLEFNIANSGNYKLSSALPLPDEMPEDDDDDESLDFHKDLVTRVFKKLNSEYSDLKNDLESDVLTLAKKLKVSL